MNQDYRSNSLEYWNDIHRSNDRKEIKTDDWLDRFDDIIMQTQKPILDLGCGSGNDTKYLLDKDKQVIPCDQSENAIDHIKRCIPEVTNVRCFNMLDGLPFEDDSFDVVIADLCLHYFTRSDTEYILSEIQRVLTPDGHLIARVNSINDINHGAGQGKEVEHHLYETEQGTLKRFFDKDDIHTLFADFKIMFLNEEVMTRYQQDKSAFILCVKCD